MESGELFKLIALGIGMAGFVGIVWAIMWGLVQMVRAAASDN